jgi:hypothetical protein
LRPLRELCDEPVGYRVYEQEYHADF